MNAEWRNINKSEATELISGGDAPWRWAVRQTGPLSADAVMDAAAYAGRKHGPEILLGLWIRDAIAPDVLAAVIGSVWSAAEYPQPSLTALYWRELFHAAGFTVDGKPANRPTEPVRLYRGSPYKYRRRWSWTASREAAEKFALGALRGRVPGQVWTVLAPPLSLLCINGPETARDEHEYVVDTRGLKITKA